MLIGLLILEEGLIMCFVFEIEVKEGLVINFKLGYYFIGVLWSKKVDKSYFVCFIFGR